MDDFELVERWRQGDLGAADEFLHKYYPLLRRFFAAKLRDESEREDLIQETLTALLPAIHRIGRLSSVKAFLFAIARNKLHDHMRKRYRAGGGYDPLHDSIEDLLGKSPSSHAATIEHKQQLLAAIGTLPVDDQILLELRYWHNMSSPELAEVFETTAEAVRARMARVRQSLQRKLAGGDPPPSGAAPTMEPFEARLRELGLELD